MKKLLLSTFIAAAAAMPAFAGLDTFNYQAVIVDNNQTLANSEVKLKFELLGNEDNVLYTQEITAKTNAAGLVTCEIGKDNDLAELDWTGNVSLRVSLDRGEGYNVISTSPVASVPTALYALHTADSEEIAAAIQEINEKGYDEKFLQITADLTRIDDFIGDADTFNDAVSTALADLMGLKASEVEDQFERIDNEIKALQEANLPELVSTVEELYQANENTQSDLTSIKADLTRVDGFIGDADTFNDAVSAALADLMGLKANEVEDQFERIDNEIKALQEANLPELVSTVEELYQANENTQSDLTSIKADLTRVDGFIGDADTFNDAVSAALADLMGLKASEVEDQFERIDNEIKALNEFKGDAETFNQAVSDQMAQLMGLNADEINDFGERITKEVQALQEFKEEADNFNQTVSDEIGRINEVLGDVDDFHGTVVSTLEPMVGLTYAEYTDFQQRVTEKLNEVNEFMDDSDTFNQALVKTLEPMMGLDNETVNDWFKRISEAITNLNDFQSDVDTNLQAVNDELAKLNGLSADEINDFHQRVTEKLNEVNDFMDDCDTFNQALVKTLEPMMGLNNETINDYFERLNSTILELQNKVEALENEIATLKGNN